MTRTAIRPAIEALLPDRMRGRPVTEKGYPVPWFASRPDGVHYDLRVADGAKIVRAVKEKLCWICGERLGRNLAFVIGPMCSINRLSSEPPQHRECAIFAAMACPFLTLPRAQRRDSNLPEGWQSADGGMLLHNPGACAVWSTRGMHVFRGPEGGILFNIGDPTEVLWFTRGRPATRAEVIEAIEIGLPFLREAAEKGGPAALAEMRAQLESSKVYLPAESAPVGASTPPQLSAGEGV